MLHSTEGSRIASNQDIRENRNPDHDVNFWAVCAKKVCGVSVLT